MARNPERAIDKTSLSIDQAEARGFIHRDYIAHCLRWSHVAKYLQQGGKYRTARILDVGCGKELPLAKLLHSSRLSPTEGWYVGVDPNKLSMPEQFANAKWQPYLLPGTQVADLMLPLLRPGTAESEAKWLPEHGQPNVLVCFEVLEHVQPAMARAMLHKFRELLAPDGVAFISTPVWDPHVGAADNHINEMRFHALGRAILDAGFSIEGVWGTFASQRDYRDQLDLSGLRDAYEKLSQYYDSNYLATVFAPLYPEQSRNCLWRLSAMDPPTTKPLLDAEYIERLRSKVRDRGLYIKPWAAIEDPWTSSPNWRDLRGGE